MKAGRLAQWIGAMAALALVPAPAQARITIDDLYLACSYTDAAAPGQVQTAHLRVADGVLATWDEAQGTWYRNACDAPQGARVIYRRCAVTDDRIYVIVSYQAGEGALTNSYDGEIVIDRLSERFTRISRMTAAGKPLLTVDQSGQCEKSDAHQGKDPPHRF